MNVSSTLKKAQAGGKTKPTYEQLVEALAESEECASEANAIRQRVVKINEEQTQHISKAEARIRVLESEKHEDREKIDGLKALLLNAEMEMARTAGYLERVAEDDDVRDAVVQTSTHEDTTLLSPRRRYNRRDAGGIVSALREKSDGFETAARPGRSEIRPMTWRDKPWSQW